MRIWDWKNNRTYNMKEIVDFLKIAERLECEYRLTRMSDNNQQAVASHSWNMAMMAIAMEPYFSRKYDMCRVLKMCVLHDLPEAIAHDVPLHKQDDVCRMEKKEQESCAIAKIMGMLKNPDIAGCFEEYEQRESPESKLVKCLDRLDTTVQHLCAKDIKYIGEYRDNFYWKLFFSDEFAANFDFEPILRSVFNEIRQQVSDRLKNELGIDSNSFIEGKNENS